jgi:hypothetical protein
MKHRLEEHPVLVASEGKVGIGRVTWNKTKDRENELRARREELNMELSLSILYS